MSAFFSSPEIAQDTPARGASLPSENSAVEQEASESVVSQFLQRELSDGELEAHIRDLGCLSEQAMSDGDPHGARLWSQRMYAAIALRSPAKRAEMEAQIQQRIDDGCNYFAAQGDKARRLLHKD